MITTHYITNKEILAKVNAVYEKYPAKVANCALNYMECNQEPILPEEVYEMFKREVTPTFGYFLMFVRPTNPEHVKTVCEFVAKHPELYEDYDDVFTPVTMIVVNPEY